MAGPRWPTRRSIRLQGYDYRQAGAYFVTFCTHGRARTLGTIMHGIMGLSEAGCIVHTCWEDLPTHYPNIELDAFVVMPAHVHGIIVLLDTVGAESRTNLAEIVRAIKSFSARRINTLRQTQGQSVWQRDYYERVIRNEREMSAIREYIESNPMCWWIDRGTPT